MARGFDSKSVSDQQEELERSRERRQQGEPQKPVLSARRRQLELARVDVLRRLETATGRYRESLEAGLAALDAQLAQPFDASD
jgi:hypothetical protein